MPITQKQFAALEARVTSLEQRVDELENPSDPPAADTLTLPPATGSDDTRAINDMLRQAADFGGSVYAPGGNCWLHAGVIEVPGGVSLLGDGPTSEFRSTDQSADGWPQHAIHLTGDKPVLQDIKVSTEWRGSRQGTPTAQAVWVQATNFRVSAVYVSGSAAGGIFCGEQPCSDGLVEACVVENTLADGIGIAHVGATRNKAVGNTVRNAGDDSISIVCYADKPQAEDCIIEGNICVDGAYARGIADVGGLRTVIRKNRVDNMPACGILTIRDDHWGTHAPEGTLIESNFVSRCANPGSGYSANYQIDNGSVNVTVRGNTSEAPGGDHYSKSPTATATFEDNVPPAGEASRGPTPSRENPNGT